MRQNLLLIMPSILPELTCSLRTSLIAISITVHGFLAFLYHTRLGWNKVPVSVAGLIVASFFMDAVRISKYKSIEFILAIVLVATWSSKTGHSIVAKHSQRPRGFLSTKFKLTSSGPRMRTTEDDFGVQPRASGLQAVYKLGHVLQVQVLICSFMHLWLVCTCNEVISQTWNLLVDKARHVANILFSLPDSQQWLFNIIAYQ